MKVLCFASTFSRFCSHLLWGFPLNTRRMKVKTLWSYWMKYTIWMISGLTITNCCVSVSSAVYGVLPSAILRSINTNLSRSERITEMKKRQRILWLIYISTTPKTSELKTLHGIPASVEVNVFGVFSDIQIKTLLGTWRNIGWLMRLTYWKKQISR